MAKYKITYSCGCTDIVQLFGSRDSRTIRAEQLRADLCPICKAKIFAEEARELGYPSLEGSPKQTAWAESIRKSAIDYYEKMKTTDNPTIEETLPVAETVLQETSAHWWIQNRFKFQSFSNFILFVNTLLVEA